jgi:hypothetical protein
MTTHNDDDIEMLKRELAIVHARLDRRERQHDTNTTRIISLSTQVQRLLSAIKTTHASTSFLHEALTLSIGLNAAVLGHEAEQDPRFVDVMAAVSAVAGGT